MPCRYVARMHLFSHPWNHGSLIMPLLSMTGYGRATALNRGIRVDVELSSINRRQLDIHVNVPRALSGLEIPVHKEIQRVIGRGRVSGTITVRYTKLDRSNTIRVNRELASAYIHELRETARSLELDGEIPTAALLDLPGVVAYEGVPEDTQQVWPVLSKALRKALRELVAMRKAEGEALAPVLVEQLDVIEKLVGRFLRRAPKVSTMYRKLLAERLERLGVTSDPDDDRLLREVAIFADKADITEELSRLESHLEQTRDMMKGKGGTGKSLDFIAQEISRELNTVGSKANDAQIAQWVVQGKTAVDRFREQVQNIE